MIRYNFKQQLYTLGSVLLVNVLFAGQFEPEIRKEIRVLSPISDYRYPGFYFYKSSGVSNHTIEKPSVRLKYLELEETLDNRKDALFLEQLREKSSMYTDYDSGADSDVKTSLALDFHQGFFEENASFTVPVYFSGGQDFIPFGKFESMMIAPTLTHRLGRTNSIPFILGYRSLEESGFFGEVYTFRSNTGNQSGVFGLHANYMLKVDKITADIGANYMGSIADSMGMQDTDSVPARTFGGFASGLHGSQSIKTVPAIGFYGNFQLLNRYKFIAEWLIVPKPFQASDLSFNGRGAKPKAAQLEVGLDFTTFFKPASVAIGYQWSDETVALNLPHHRFCGIFNIALGENIIGSFEYRHDIDFSPNHFGNGIAPTGELNQIKVGSGRSLDAMLARVKFNI